MIKKIKNQNVYCIVADNKPILVASIFSKLSKEFLRKALNDKKFVLLLIICPCGKRYEYEWIDDIPDKSIDCSCGVHLIKYKSQIIGEAG